MSPKNINEETIASMHSIVFLVISYVFTLYVLL